MTRRVIYTPQSVADLDAIYDYISQLSGHTYALDYVQRIREHADSLSDFPERGAPRGEGKARFRILPMQRRVAIAYHITEDAVIVDRIRYAGRER